LAFGIRVAYTFVAEGISGASGLASAASVIFRLGGAVRLCLEKRTTDKSLMFNRIRVGSDLLPLLSR
jgi:hypothetical protein